MDLTTYRQAIESIPFGKRVHSSVYFYRGSGAVLGEPLDSLLSRVEAAYSIGQEFNVVKFRVTELKISFLSYPRFMEDAHPELQAAVTIDLVTGRTRQTSYASIINPPILHRKESFLPLEHPLRETFSALTQEEEAVGLYKDPSAIGFLLNWKRLLAEKCICIDGHKLIQKAHSIDPVILGASPLIERHKTAISRGDLSKPVKTALEYGLLGRHITFFDYGCGRGEDVVGLTRLGVKARGWDPSFRPDESRDPADVVNFGYVLNVIEDPAERLEALCSAFRLAQKLLIVSGLIRTADSLDEPKRFRDGVLSRRNTFQKYFEQQELQQFIEDALDITAVPVALGIFYVFRDSTDQQDFLAARTRRTVDWTQLGHRLGLRKPRVRIDLYERHRELLDAFYGSALNLGRMPGSHEFAREAELLDQLKSPKRAYKIILEKFGPETLEKAKEVRAGDLLVYLALSNIRKAVSFRHLSDKLRNDVRSFFGDWRTALAKSREALFAAGDPGEIELSCDGLDLGWQDEYSLTIHRSLLNELPPLLRIYVHCAAHRYGDPSQADLIKIHKRSGKVTFQHFDDFDGKPMPELQTRIKVNLRSLFVEVFDHSKAPKTQLLYFKERFVSNAYPNRAAMERFSAKLRKLGFEEKTIGFGPDKETLLRMLEGAGLNERLNPVRKQRHDRNGRPSLSYLTGEAK